MSALLVAVICAAPWGKRKRERGTGLLAFGGLGARSFFGAAVEIKEDGLFPILWVELAVDGREGVEEQVAGVSHDGGATGSDLVAGEEFVKFAEGAVDGDRGSELVGVTDEPGGDMDSVAVFL